MHSSGQRDSTTGSYPPERAAALPALPVLWVPLVLLVWPVLLASLLVPCTAEAQSRPQAQPAPPALPAAAAPSTSAATPSPERGRQLYESRCTACHSIDTNRTGPLHAGVLGRRAGSVSGFAYSPALAASGLVWTRANLRAWLANPEALVPGQAMGYQVPEPQDREDIVAYLATLRSAGPVPVVPAPRT